MGLSEITSLLRACHNLEGSLSMHESKFLSENPVVLPAAGKDRINLSIFPRPHAALVEQIARNLRRRLSEPALQERYRFRRVGGVQCQKGRHRLDQHVSISGQTKINLCFTSSGISLSASSSV